MSIDRIETLSNVIHNVFKLKTRVSVSLSLRSIATLERYDVTQGILSIWFMNIQKNGIRRDMPNNQIPNLPIVN